MLSPPSIIKPVFDELRPSPKLAVNGSIYPANLQSRIIISVQNWTFFLVPLIQVLHNQIFFWRGRPLAFDDFDDGGMGRGCLKFWET